MLASAEGQRPAAGAFESTAGEGGPAGLRVWSWEVWRPAGRAERRHQEQRAAAQSAAAEEEQTTGQSWNQRDIWGISEASMWV